MKKYLVLFFAGIGLYLAACNKTGLVDTGSAPYPVPDSSKDVRRLLDSGEFKLFGQAAKRAGLDSLLLPGSYFTVLAPVDSAMQAAGLTADVIAGLPEDSLQKIVFTHVARGPYSPASLTAAVSSIQAASLRQDFSVDKPTGNVFIYQQSLFLKISGVLYANGEPVNTPSDTPYTASNGYVYPIRSVIHAPGNDIWGVLESRPELSLYLAALRINDSLYYSNGLATGYGGVVMDSVLFNNVLYTNQTPVGEVNTSALVTVFAPTNDAFGAAGFHSVDDLRAFATRLGFVGPNPNAGPGFFYSPLDSVLKQHLVSNSHYYYSNLSLYNDLLLNPNINNGGFNGFYPTLEPIYRPVFALQFANQSGVVGIQWSTDPAQPPAVLPADRNRHFMATNGVVYEIDQLFYPHN